MASDAMEFVRPPPDMSLIWHPISELANDKRYGDEAGFLLCAPELVDGDCNVHGVGPGYWQDDRDMPTDKNGACGDPNVDYGGWLAAKWSMTNDEWYEIPVSPTHYARIRGPRE
jgi:hypothetical protein